VQVFREDGLLSKDTGMGPGMDWYEGALVRPADLLKDMLRAVRPDLVEVSHPMSNMVARRKCLMTCRLQTGICSCHWVHTVHPPRALASPRAEPVSPTQPATQVSLVPSPDHSTPTLS
jgi:hypothetical protein